MTKALLLSLLVTSVLPLAANAENHVSGLREVEGIKYPNSPWEGVTPVKVTALRLDRFATPQGFTELLPYVLASPDQEDSGTCLYMAHTGVVGWWLAKLNPSLSRSADGPIDLSERFTVNAAGVDQWSGSENWLTDTINVFNRSHGAVRNVDYRYTKGWYVKDNNGRSVPADRNTRGASYGTAFNWINQLDQLQNVERVKLPKFQREILFADPEKNQWNVGIMPDNIVTEIKHALKANKAPVVAIYNHFGYWHAAMIVGYDDKADNKNCSFVNQFLNHNLKQSRDAADSGARELALSVYKKAKAAFDRGGGCQSKGMFYVRDSIYTNKNAPYDFDPRTTGDEGHYSDKLTMLEYDWIRVMGNHAYQITAKPVNDGNRSSEF